MKPVVELGDVGAFSARPRNAKSRVNPAWLLLLRSRVMPDPPPPKRRGRPRLYDPAQLAELAQEAADTLLPGEEPRHLRSPKSQQDHVWEKAALAVLIEWQRLTEPEWITLGHPAARWSAFSKMRPGPEGIHPDRKLDWWESQPRPSALAELGRLGNRELIVAMARLINTVQPRTTKEAVEGMRVFRLALNKLRV
jgi:hypothetical protein